MRILHLIWAFPVGGTETMLVDIINEQCKYETVILIVLNKRYDEDLLSKISHRAKIYLLNRKEGSLNFLPILKFNLILAKIKPSIIHCHNYAIASLISPFNTTKKVLTIHTTNITSKHFEKYDKLFAISKAIQQDVKHQSNLDAIVIYNGVRINNIQFKTKNESTTFKIIQVGRLEHTIKGQDILIRAVNILINKYNIKDVHLDFIGQGTSLLFLNELVDRLNLNNNISFLGLRDRNFIYTHLKDYDLLVQPSLFEGFGLSIIEALVAGIEVLVSAIDGPLEIIKKTNSGFIFKRGNADDCALKIYKIYSDRNNVDSHSKFELQRLACKKYFNIEITARKYLEEYKNLLRT